MSSKVTAHQQKLVDKFKLLLTALSFCLETKCNE